MIFALEEMGAPYQMQWVEDGTFVETEGVIGPRLIDGSVELMELDTMLRYLGAKAGTWPRDPARAAQVDAWLEMQTVWVRPLALRYNMARRRRRQDDPVAQRDFDTVARVLDRMDRWLGTRDWATDVFTLADCRALHLVGLPSLGFDLGAYPNLTAYLERVVGRPAYARAEVRLKRVGSGPVGAPPGSTA